MKMANRRTAVEIYVTRQRLVIWTVVIVLLVLLHV